VPHLAEEVSAWTSPTLADHVIVGGYNVAPVTDSAERRRMVDELVRLELAELARIGQGRVVVRQSSRDGLEAALTIVTGVDAANSLVFAYYFVVSPTVVVKLKRQHIGLDLTERAVLTHAAEVAGSLVLREITLP